MSADDAVAGVDVIFATATLEGDSYGQQVGRSTVSVGDQDGDGYGDLVVGARSNCTEARESGAALLFYGPLSGDLAPSNADAAWYGSSSGAGTPS